MARRKRENGAGSVMQLSNGRWRAYFTMKNGERREFTAKTQQAAVQKRNKAWEEYKAGQLTDKNKLKVADVMAAWLETKHHRKYNTYRQYANMIRIHLAPALGDMPLQKLDSDDVQRFVNSLAAQGKAPNTVHMAYAVLAQVMRYAVKRKFIGRSPCHDIELPHVDEDADDIQPLDAEQAKALLAACRGHKLECFITLALTTGLRRGELLALHWKDIKLDKRELTVRSTLIFEPGKGYYEGPPKTKDSRRTVMLADIAIAQLRVHKARQQLAERIAGAAWQEKDLVFCTETGGYIGYNVVGYWYPRLLKAAGLPHFHFHALRHTAGTLLLALGESQKVVQNILGHTTMKMTNRYLHVIPVMKHTAAARFDTLFSDAAAQ